MGAIAISFEAQSGIIGGSVPHLREASAVAATSMLLATSLATGSDEAISAAAHGYDPQLASEPTVPNDTFKRVNEIGSGAYRRPL